jgi:hypothetical protein
VITSQRRPLISRLADQIHLEGHNEPPATRRVFALRVLHFALMDLVLIIFSLFIGCAGYRIFEHLSWIDALLNASMLLFGMGPVNSMQTVGGKLFASFYAMYSGVVFMVLIGIVSTPIFHRILHNFNYKEGE